MVDFRFHLISIVAVFLALGLGILTGSGFVGDALVKRLRRDVNLVKESNNELHQQVDELQGLIAEESEFSAALRPEMVASALRDVRVVLIEIGEPAEGSSDELRATVEEAGGRVTGSITFTDKLALTGDAERDQLSLIVGPAVGEAGELIDQTGSLLGLRLGSAAQVPSDTDQRVVESEELLRDLEDAGFVEVERDDDGRTAPNKAAFLILGGNADPPPFDAGRLALALASSITARAAPVLVTEPAESSWGMVEAVRADSEARENVATAERAESVYGQVAAVVGLSLEIQREPFDPAAHYGLGAGATEVMPPLPER